MIPIVVVPFASEIHGKEYYAGVLEVIRKYLASYGIDMHKDIVTDKEKAEAAGKRYSNALPIVLTLTGGTSRLIHTFVEAGGIERVILLSHGEHNSLASAVSARNRIEREGGAAELFFCPEYYSKDCEYTVMKMMAIARATASVINTRVGLVADRGKEEVEETFEAKFNSTVEMIPFDEVLSEMSKVGDEEAKDLLEKVDKVFEYAAPKDHMLRALKLYMALERLASLRRLNAIAVDCFPFIAKHKLTPCIPLSILNARGVVALCEGDLTVLPAMYIAKTLTGKSGWIANLTMLKANKALFAHCTVPMDLAKSLKVTAHFETANPYALSGELIASVVTVASADRDFTIMALDRGRLLASGPLAYAACKTQALVEFDFSVEEMGRYAPSNHHVLIPGDLVDIIRSAAYLLGLDAISYRELLVW